jgi:ADP-ribosylglycohydrolase
MVAALSRQGRGPVSAEATRRKFLGSVIGAAVGDTVGAALEFWDPEHIATHPAGSQWITEMLPVLGRPIHPLGLWRQDPPLGTATDDTRLNQVFVESAIKYGGMLNSKLLASEYIDRYLNRDRYYPGYHDLATQQFGFAFSSACGVLDMECPLHPGMPPFALRSGARGRGMPSLSGLLAIPTAGLLHPGDPDAAYAHALELAYMDIGYAKDATALLAALIAIGFNEELSPREAIRKGLEIDPFGFGEGRRLGGHWPVYRMMVEHINHFLEIADQVETDRDLVLALSREVAGLHPFDPIDILGIPVAACYRANGDPKRAILMAVNNRDFDADGTFRRFRDIDCDGSVCGALVGALADVDAFPPEWIAATVAANREVYGFDLEKNANRLYEVICPPA